MLTRIEIQNFRSCHDVVLDDLGPLTVLVGRNAVGKTNILRAIHWLSRTATSVIANESVGRPAHFSVQAAIGNAVYQYALKFNLFFTSQPDVRLESDVVESLRYGEPGGAQHTVLERRNDKLQLSLPATPERVNIGKTVPCMPALVSLLPPASPAVDLIQPFLSAVEAIRYYPLVRDENSADDAPVVLQDAYDQWLARYRGAGDPGASVLMRLLHMFLARRSQFEEVQSLLGPDGLGLLDGILIDTESDRKPKGQDALNRYHLVVFTPSLQSDDDPGLYSFRDLSAGTQRVIKILVSLLFDQPSVMLLEHPEECIHGGLLRKLIDLLRGYSDQSQLIISSHSPVVFNSLDPEAVRLVTMDQGKTKVRALTPVEMEAVGKYLEDEGSLADFLETVEGE